MHKKNLKWPEKFGIIYGTGLTVFTVFVLLYTFTIPRQLRSAAETARAVQESETENVSAASPAPESETENVSAASSEEPVVTDNSYKDGNISISWTQERIDHTTCYIADVQLSDVSCLKTAFAQDTYGRNIKQKTSDMAREHRAVLAINGDFYGFRDYGYVLRNGVLYRENGGNDQDLVIDSDGAMRIIKESEVSASDLARAGAWQVFSFGPALVENAQSAVDADTEVARSMTSNPRTAIGMISPLHYLIIVSDGRAAGEEGLTLAQLAEIFLDYGAAVAYNLDGGGSSTLYFNGKVINHPTGGARGESERRVSDIIYISGD